MPHTAASGIETMRIIAGKYKSRRLVTPRGMDVRPTADRARECLFNIMQNVVAGARILDLFAGTGAVGLEALSRGAILAVFVEKDPRAQRALDQNINSLGVRTDCRVMRRDWLEACRILREEGVRFDVIFADPPYDSAMAETCLLSECTGDILEPEGLLILEHRKKTLLPDPPGWLRQIRKSFSGEAAFSLYKREVGP